MENIAVIGLGNMGTSLIEGILSANIISPDNIWATRKHTEKSLDLIQQGVHVINNNIKAVENAKIIFIALKPDVVPLVLDEIHPVIHEEHILISIASGTSIKEINDIIGDKPGIFRAMPNTASGVGEGVTCIATNSEDEESLNRVKLLFNHLGKSIVIDENLMDSATIIGACGVAYALRFMRSMIQGAIQIGFDSNTATEIVTQMVKGSAELLIQNGKHPEEEIDRVTTPMGCTITGLNEMEHQGFSSALIKGIVASFEKI
ncbi:MAG: pyrroline-5-carboxylate reductase [Flavobacteriaceae bacterium]|nr:pyrroline-5-carboxylate reductase [Flavobacteriaceae bacterium]